MSILYYFINRACFTLIILSLFFSYLMGMDPIVHKLSLLHLPQIALVKILTNNTLKEKDRKHLMHTCHKLHFMTTPKNLLKESIPLDLFNNIFWPLQTLETAIQSRNHTCCEY